jgi:hypothetical protein
VTPSGGGIVTPIWEWQFHYLPQERQPAGCL